MPRLVGIVGMPGSGKSHLIQKYCNDPYSAFIAFDDMGYASRWMKNTPEFFKGPWEKTISLTVTALALGFDVLIADIAFCNDAFRDEIQTLFPVHQIEWEFFEKDPVQCKINVEKRNRPEPKKSNELRAIDELTPKYSPPLGSHPVYRRDSGSQQPEAT